MQSDLKIKRGLFKNTVNVDGEDYKVNEGYFRPGIFGFGVGSVAHAVVHGGKPFSLKNSLIAGSIGAVTSLGIEELKRLKLQKVLNENKSTSISLAKKGFNIKSRVSNAGPVISGLAAELLKESSLSESKLIRKLDQVEDDHIRANAITESSVILGFLSGLPKSNSVLDGRVANSLTKANIVYTALADKDDTLADASAGAQFAIYSPRMFSDSKNMISGGRKNLIKNAITTLARSAPALAPVSARFLKKQYSDT